MYIIITVLDIFLINFLKNEAIAATRARFENSSNLKFGILYPMNHEIENTDLEERLQEFTSFNNNTLGVS